MRFTCGISKRTGNHYIYGPDGKPVIRYWWFPVEQMRNGVKEYNAEFLHGKDKTICCVYGGLTRSLLAYLNNGVFLNKHDVNDLYDGAETVRRLDKLRERFQ